MGDFKIFNTLTKKKEVFVPHVPGEVKMYVCGPTVYDFLHVGNFRPLIFFNVVRNWLEKKGFKVKHVQNYTDVDDKIIERAQKLAVSPEELTLRFIKEYETDSAKLHITKHHFNPKVTEYIPQIVTFIQRLIKADMAYVVDGEVFYAIKNFDGYGKLSQKNIDELQSGIRVEIDSKKKNPLDFTLWKPAKPGEPKWPSPWSEGRPGWHIECSVMAHEILGEQFDIHGGGIDLIFPHHENEIAQTEGVTKKQMVRYWMHNNFINMGGEKMSKSLGNIVTGRGFMERYNPEILKFLLLMSHYRSHSDFSESQIDHAIRGLARIYSALAATEKVLESDMAALEDPKFKEALEKAQSGMREAFDDDINTPEVFARVFEMTRLFNAGWKWGAKITPQLVWRAQGLRSIIGEAGQVMALFEEKPVEFLRALDDLLLTQMNLKREDIDKLVADRATARVNKDFKASDDLRAQLTTMGIAVQDTMEGSVWEVQK